MLLRPDAYFLHSGAKGEGFVYAGETRDGLVKVGKSIRQCPLCRMDQNNLDYLGLVWCRDASAFEQRLITEMGVPAKGFEWFDDPFKIRELIDDGWLHDVEQLESRVAIQTQSKLPPLLTAD